MCKNQKDHVLKLKIKERNKAFDSNNFTCSEKNVEKLPLESLFKRNDTFENIVDTELMNAISDLNKYESEKNNLKNYLNKQKETFNFTDDIYSNIFISQKKTSDKNSLAKNFTEIKELGIANQAKTNNKKRLSPSIFKRHMKTRSSRVNNAHETRLKHVEYAFKTRGIRREYAFKTRGIRV
jgi:mannose/fructose/N-acetylgalactosamine-specific phosphotransferase system component IIB